MEQARKTFLIADDSKVVRTIARSVLRELNFKTEEAVNGAEALSYCQKNLPDAVLLDWNMPVMDGFSFLKALRQIPGGDRPVVVFCTTESDADSIQRALESGADEYIMKPFTPEIVRDKLGSIGLIGPLDECNDAHVV